MWITPKSLESVQKTRTKAYSAAKNHKCQDGIIFLNIGERDVAQSCWC